MTDRALSLHSQYANCRVYWPPSIPGKLSWLNCRIEAFARESAEAESRGDYSFQAMPMAEGCEAFQPMRNRGSELPKVSD